MRKILTQIFLDLKIDKILNKIYYIPKSVEITKIRCQKEKKYSELCGFGAQPIELFPPFNVFKEYLKNIEKSKNLFKEIFYDNVFNKNLLSVPKKIGGGLHGSLYKVIENLYEQNNIVFNKTAILENKNIIEDAIDIRINHYFSVFESIKKQGFNPKLDPIYAEKEKKFYYLLDGHHRVAMLSVLGYKRIIITTITKIKKFLDKITLKFL